MQGIAFGPYTLYWPQVLAREIRILLNRIEDNKLWLEFIRCHNSVNVKISTLRRLDTHGRFSAVFHKEDNLRDFYFAFLHSESFLKRSLFLKGKNLLPREQNF